MAAKLEKTRQKLPTYDLPPSFERAILDVMRLDYPEFDWTLTRRPRTNKTKATTAKRAKGASDGRQA